MSLKIIYKYEPSKYCFFLSFFFFNCILVIPIFFWWVVFVFFVCFYICQLHYNEHFCASLSVNLYAKNGYGLSQAFNTHCQMIYFLIFNFEIILDSHRSCQNITESAIYPSPAPSSDNIVHNHS